MKAESKAITAIREKYKNEISKALQKEKEKIERLHKKLGGEIINLLNSNVSFKKYLDDIANDNDLKNLSKLLLEVENFYTLETPKKENANKEKTQSKTKSN